MITLVKYSVSTIHVLVLLSSWIHATHKLAWHTLSTNLNPWNFSELETSAEGFSALFRG